MSINSNRYQKLEPFSINQSIYIALAALRFFSLDEHKRNCEKLGKTPQEKSILPFSGMDFIDFIKGPGKIPADLLPEPDRHFRRIDELLRKLAFAGFLTDFGVGGSPILGNKYFSLYQATSIERTGALYLARVLGPSFINWAYKNGIYQITGSTTDGEHSGTAIAIAPRWLLTCAHVVKDMQVYDKQLYKDQEFQILEKISHDEVDVALIKVDRDLQVVQSLNFRDPNIGERVYTFGYPLVPLSKEALLVMQGGEVSAERMQSLFGEELFLFSAIARPGNSGGPIISEDGHVVGIVTKELCVQGNEDKRENKNSLPNHPFHAGIATSTLECAIKELTSEVALPVETWN